MSTAFWSAFWSGLACPTQAYIRPHEENYKDIGRVDRAWEKVGQYIYQSMNSSAEESHGRHHDKWAK
jgi:hypothetical protein